MYPKLIKKLDNKILNPKKIGELGAAYNSRLQHFPAQKKNTLKS